MKYINIENKLLWPYRLIEDFLDTNFKYDNYICYRFNKCFRVVFYANKVI